jgi:hypothetical protein
MNAKEIEEALEDLETRMERLRALYEQYFMGIERLEPQIPRKDVDRRIWILRREQIRNTGLRFRFQMLVQRYNTYQQYWGRVTREIENGTYKRDVLRAAARVGAREALTIVGKKRAERFAALVAAQAEAEAARKAAPARGREPDGLEHVPDDLEFVEDAAEPAAAPPTAALTPPLGVELARRRVAELAAQGKAQRSSSPEAVAPAMGPLALDLDLDLVGSGPALRHDKDPAPPGRSLPPSPGLASRPPPPPSSRTAAPPPPSSVRSAPLPSPPPSSPAMAPPVPAPATPPAPARAPAAPRSAAQALSTDPSDLPDARLRQIYAQYVQTKRTLHESTAGVTFDKLAKSLRDQAERLRVAHGKRAVDYEVVVKDGKAVIRPVLR